MDIREMLLDKIENALKVVTYTMEDDRKISEIVRNYALALESLYK